MTNIPEWLRRQVKERAHDRCEYCLMPDIKQYFHHEPDHVIAEKHGGATSFDNLAWACFSCNRHKGSDIASLDPLSGKVTLLFNPRMQQWRRHFRLNGGCIEPLTAAGRVTVAILQLNDPVQIQDRLRLMASGLYP